VTLGLAVGAALLAAWLDARLGDARPQAVKQIFLHAALSVVALMGSVGLLSLVYGIPQATFMVVVLTVFLPALVYTLLAGFWMVRALTGSTDLVGR
jgi:hypothetical protein